MSGWSLRHKLTALVVALVIAISAGFGLYFPHRMAARSERAVEQRAQVVSAILASAVTPALDFGDAETAERNLSYLGAAPEVLWAAVWRADGTRFAAWRGEVAPERLPAGSAEALGVVFDRELAIATAPLRTPTGEDGVIGIAFSLAEPHREQRADWVAVLAMCGLALLVGTGGAYGIGSLLIRPIQRISRAARRVADGEIQLDRLDLQVLPGDRDSHDESRQLTAAVAGMASRLAQQVHGLDRAREVAEEAEEVAIAASQAKSVFLANMSHELRTPLNAIIGYSEILIDEYATDGLLCEDLGKINAAATHLCGLISGILDISKVEAGRMELAIDEWELPRAVRDVCNAVRPLARKNRSELTVEIAPEVGSVSGDQTKVRQILLNLLSNAVKFTADGWIHLGVRRAISADGRGWIVFTVRDSGIGMTEEQLQRVFLPFTQADASTTKRFGGTGLGLTITQRFCELMGGRISVESHPSTGSTFTVELPERMATPTPAPSQWRAPAERSL